MLQDTLSVSSADFKRHELLVLLHKPTECRSGNWREILPNPAISLDSLPWKSGNGLLEKAAIV
jgi:hypothetical protein